MKLLLKKIWGGGPRPVFRVAAYLFCLYVACYFGDFSGLVGALVVLMWCDLLSTIRSIDRRRCPEEEGTSPFDAVDYLAKFVIVTPSHKPLAPFSYSCPSCRRNGVAEDMEPGDESGVHGRRCGLCGCVFRWRYACKASE